MESQQPTSDRSPAGLGARGVMGALSDTTVFVENSGEFIIHHLIMFQDQTDTVQVLRKVPFQSADPFTLLCCVNRP